ncbi:MAG: hypothetical protein ABIK44_06335, partial [candidate division WOR-3 bacterium]
ALAIYTVAFRSRPDAPKLWSPTASQRLSAAVLTEATGAAKAKGVTGSPGADSIKPSGVAATQPAPKEFEPIVWGSDPFVREWVLINELANLNLKAITIGGDRASVLINDQILEEGDVISGKRVIAIEPDKVILEQGGRTFTLTLGE